MAVGRYWWIVHRVNNVLTVYIAAVLNLIFTWVSSVTRLRELPFHTPNKNNVTENRTKIDQC